MKYGYAMIAGLLATGIAPAYAATASTRAASNAPQEVAAIKHILDTACVDMVNKKIDGTTWYYQPDIIVYDLVPPLISDSETVKEGNRHWHEIVQDPFNCKYEDIQVRMLGPDHAFSGSIIYITAKLKAGGDFAIRMRSTNIWEKTTAGWRAIHEHTSVPFDAATGKALFTLPLNKPNQVSPAKAD